MDDTLNAVLTGDFFLSLGQKCPDFRQMNDQDESERHTAP